MYKVNGTVDTVPDGLQRNEPIHRPSLPQSLQLPLAQTRPLPSFVLDRALWWASLVSCLQSSRSATTLAYGGCCSSKPRPSNQNMLTVVRAAVKPPLGLRYEGGRRAAGRGYRKEGSLTTPGVPMTACLESLSQGVGGSAGKRSSCPAWHSRHASARNGTHKWQDLAASLPSVECRLQALTPHLLVCEMFVAVSHCTLITACRHKSARNALRRRIALDFLQLFTVVFKPSDGWVIKQDLWCVSGCGRCAAARECRAGCTAVWQIAAVRGSGSPGRRVPLWSSRCASGWRVLFSRHDTERFLPCPLSTRQLQALEDSPDAAIRRLH